MTDCQTCDASAVVTLLGPPSMLGPCILRHGHDGPVHKDANGAAWTDSQPSGCGRECSKQHMYTGRCEGAAAEEPDDTCRPVEVDGETLRVRGARDMTEQERGYLAEVIRAAKRKYASEHPETGRAAPAGDDATSSGDGPPAHSCGSCEGIDPDSCLANPDQPRTSADRTLRDRYGEVIEHVITSGDDYECTDPEHELRGSCMYQLPGEGGCPRVFAAREGERHRLRAEAAVRDDELAQLRAQVAKWEAVSTEWAVRAQHAETRLAEARRFCQLVAEGSCRVQAAQQARDTLAVLDGATLRVIDAAPTPEAGDA